MTFSFKKTLSRLHPRRRSTNSHLESPPTPPPSLSSPPSSPELRPSLANPALGDFFSPPIEEASYSKATPSGIDILKARITALEAVNSELQAKILSLTNEAQMREEELSSLRSDYFIEVSTDIVRRRKDAASHQMLDQRLERAQRFLTSIVETGLHNPVLSEAWQAVKAGQPADDALVESIKKAASRPGTSWSTIIPAVTGPRTPEHYLSAINLTLKTRRDLKKAIQVGRFWKKMAKKDSTHTETVTPSASDLSDVSLPNEFKPKERKTELDDLLAKIRSNGLPLRTKMSDLNSGVPKTSPDVPIEPISISASESRTLVPAFVTFTVAKSNSSTNQDTVSLEAVQGSPRREPTTAPSKSLPTGLRTTRPTKRDRPVLRSVDLNADDTSRILLSSKFKSPSKRSTKAFVKRGSATTAGPFLPHADDIRSTELATTAPASKTELSPLPDSGMLAAEKALLSLERICAGLSSGSLGSLGTISAGGSCHQLQSLGSAFNVGPPGDHRSSTTPYELPISTSDRSFVQVSSLPVLSHCQLSPSSELNSPSRKIKPNDRGIPAATTHDTLGDDLTPGTLHSNSLEGSSRAAPEDVPGHTNTYFSDLFSSALVTPSTYRPTNHAVHTPAKVLTAPSSQRSPVLAPLASHVLRCEMAEHSHRQLPRRVFGKSKVDDEGALSRMLLPADKENRTSPGKTLRRRKGMVFAGRFQPVTASVINPEDDRHAPTSTSHGYPEDHRPPVVQRPDVNTISISVSSSTSSRPQAKSSRRPSLIPVFIPRSTLSPIKKYPPPQYDAACPSLIHSSTLRPTANRTRPKIPSPLRLTQKRVAT